MTTTPFAEYTRAALEILERGRGHVPEATADVPRSQPTPLYWRTGLKVNFYPGGRHRPPLVRVPIPARPLSYKARRTDG